MTEAPLRLDLVRDYLILVSWVTIGVLQVVASFRSLQGLMLFSSRRMGIAAGICILIVSFVWFLLSDDRQISGEEGGLEGSQQFSLFLAGAFAGYLFTIVAASIFRRNLRLPSRTPLRSMSALRSHTLFQLLTLRKNVKKQKILGERPMQKRW